MISCIITDSRALYCQRYQRVHHNYVMRAISDIKVEYLLPHFLNTDSPKIVRHRRRKRVITVELLVKKLP